MDVLDLVNTVLTYRCKKNGVKFIRVKLLVGEKS